MIVDAHNDLLTELAFFEDEDMPFENRWHHQLRQGGVRLQVCPVFVSRESVPTGSLTQAVRQIAAFHRAIRESDATAVLNREDLVGLEDGDSIGLMLSMEGAEPLGNDPSMVNTFWELGVRMFALTWNDRNPFADGAGEAAAGGLSRLGQDLLDRLLELDIVIDLAHASEGTFWDVLERTADAQLVVSHASCRAIHDTPRNLSDSQMRALAERDSVVGLMAHPLVVDPLSPTLDRFLDHIEHATTIMGTRHVGLGSDFIRQVALSGAIEDVGNALLPTGMALSDSIEGFSGPAEYPALVSALKKRGIDDEALQGILGGNFLRVFEAALPSSHG